MSYLKQALKILKLEPTQLLEKYFSNNNVEYLQNTIISETKKQTGVKIGKQSYENLLGIMIFMYEVYKLEVIPIPVNTGVNKLNAYVLQKALPAVVNNVIAQKNYITYISKPREPISNPISTSSRGRDVYDYRPGL